VAQLPEEKKRATTETANVLALKGGRNAFIETYEIADR